MVVDVGNLIEVTRDSMRVNGSVPSGNVFVDGLELRCWQYCFKR